MAPGRAARLLDIAQSRSGTVLAEWLAAQTPDWRARVGTASLDPFRGYATALATQLPAATRVLDPFHVVKLGVSCLDDVRRRVQHDTTGHRGRTGDPLYGIRRVLRRRRDRLSVKARGRLNAGLIAGDPTGETTAASMKITHRHGTEPAVPASLRRAAISGAQVIDLLTRRRTR